MASVKKFKGSKYWYACFNGMNGKRYQKSTKETSKAKALKIALEWEDIVRRKVSAQYLIKKNQEIASIAWGRVQKDICVKDYADAYINRKRGGEVEESTWHNYRITLNEFISYLGERGSASLSAVTSDDISGFRDMVAARTSNNNANKKLKHLRIFFRDAEDRGMLICNNAKSVKSLKKEDSVRRPFTIKELRLLMKVADNEWKGMILAGVYTGQRLGDIAKLCWRHIDMEKRELRSVSSKTNRVVLLPIADSLYQWILAQDCKSVNSPLFPRSYKAIEGNRRRIGTLSNRFHDLMVNAGIISESKFQGVGRYGKREKSEISFHCLRHTATSMLKEAGVPESVVRDIIGHESVAISRHYTHVSEDSKRKALELMPDLK